MASAGAEPRAGKAQTRSRTRSPRSAPNTRSPSASQSDHRVVDLTSLSETEPADGPKEKDPEKTGPTDGKPASQWLAWDGNAFHEDPGLIALETETAHQPRVLQRVFGATVGVTEQPLEYSSELGRLFPDVSFETGFSSLADFHSTALGDFLAELEEAAQGADARFLLLAPPALDFRPDNIVGALLTLRDRWASPRASALESW